MEIFAEYIQKKTFEFYIQTVYIIYNIIFKSKIFKYSKFRRQIILAIILLYFHVRYTFTL